MRCFLVNEVLEPGFRTSLSPDQARHAARVLRLAPGQAVELADAVGGRFTARIVEITPDSCLCQVESACAPHTESPLGLDVAMGFLRAGQMDDLIPMATELGVRTFLPFFASRCVARPDPGKLRARLERWERISRESIKQCGRNRPMAVGPAVNVADLVEQAASHDRAVVFWEGAGLGFCPDPSHKPDRPKTALVVFGPEGGLAFEEVETLVTAGFETAGLGPRVLRARTALVAGVALVQAAWGDMGDR